METRPNILLIMADQQRLDSVGAYGTGMKARTPYIDSIANRGIRFDWAFTPTSICSPARASLLTGVYPHKHGVIGNGLTLAEDAKGIQEYLQEAGYRCGYAGKWHVDQRRGPSQMGFVAKDFLGYAFPASGLLPGLGFGALQANQPNHYATYLRERGFDLPTVSHRFVGTNPTNQAQEMFALHDGPVESTIDYFVAEETNRVMEELAKGDAPFFLWANFWGPHTPCLIPEPYFSMYDPNDFEEHPSYKETFEKKPYRQKLIERMWGLSDYGWNGFQQIIARYLAHCTLIDDMVGRIFNKLKEVGAWDNTVIIYTADHGDCMGAHRLIEKGEFMYDETYRIPFLVAHPNCRNPGGKNADFVYLHELAPSILNIAGFPVPAHMDGQSLLPQILGDVTGNGRENVFCVFERHFTVAQQRMVRTRSHQLTFNSADMGELYDLSADPYQLENVYDDPHYGDVRETLLSTMGTHMRSLEDPLYRWFRQIKGVY